MYTVIYTDFPEAPTDPARFFLDLRTAQLEKAPGRVVLERPLDLRGIPGFELRVEYRDGTVGHSRMYLRGTRLYNQSAFGHLDAVFTSQFIESFGLR